MHNSRGTRQTTAVKIKAAQHRGIRPACEHTSGEDTYYHKLGTSAFTVLSAAG